MLNELFEKYAAWKADRKMRQVEQGMTDALTSDRLSHIQLGPVTSDSDVFPGPGSFKAEFTSPENKITQIVNLVPGSKIFPGSDAFRATFTAHSDRYGYEVNGTINYKPRDQDGHGPTSSISTDKRICPLNYF